MTAADAQLRFIAHRIDAWHAGVISRILASARFSRLK
jgi:hypothetical protein